MSDRITPPICTECGDQYAADDVLLCPDCLETTCVGCGERRELDVFGQCASCVGEPVEHLPHDRFRRGDDLDPGHVPTREA